MDTGREWEMNSIAAIIHSLSNSFTKSEKKIADVLLNNLEEAIYYSVTDFAEKAGVGDTSIIRFCRKLGFRGYQDFKIALTQDLTRNQQQAVRTLDNEITLNDSIGDVIRKLMNNYHESLKETLSLLKEDQVVKAVDFIESSNRVIFFGVGVSGLTAMEAKYKFSRIGLNVDAYLDSHMQVMSAALLSKNDTAIAISYSGSTKDTIEALSTAKEAGAKTICITHYAKSPITRYADLILLNGHREDPLQGGALATKIAQLYVLDILYTEYFRRNFQKAGANKEKTSRSITDKLI